MDAIRAQRTPIEDLMYLPEAASLKAAAFGYEPLVADVLWLTTIQVVGRGGVADNAPWIYRAIDTVTTLDPKFAFAYQFGGLLLSSPGPPLQLGDALLQKGERENPDVWQMPFYMGFNDYFYRKDYAAAAKKIARAARLTGSPSGLAEFAAGLYLRAGEPQTALIFLGTMIQDAQDETVREILQERARAILHQNTLTRP